MKLHEMKTNCRMCGKEIYAETKDSEFVSFYCMKCGIYTTKPIEEFDQPPPPAPAPAPAAGTLPAQQPDKKA